MFGGVLKIISIEISLGRGIGVLTPLAHIQYKPHFYSGVSWELGITTFAGEHPPDTLPSINRSNRSTFVAIPDHVPCDSQLF